MRLPPPSRMYRPISPTRATSERTCSSKSSSTLTRSSSTRPTISLRSATRLPLTGSTVATNTLPVVRELHVDPQIRLLQSPDHGLQVVPVLARDPHLVGLDGGLDLDLHPLDDLYDLARLLGRDALL